MIRIDVPGQLSREFPTYELAINYLQELSREERIKSETRRRQPDPVRSDPDPSPSISDGLSSSIGGGFLGGGGSFGGGGASGGWDPPSTPDFSDVQSGSSSTGGND